MGNLISNKAQLIRMLPELLAVGAAFFYALSNNLIRKGLDHGTILQAVFFSLVVNTLVYWMLSLTFVDLHLFLSTGVIWFVIAGILAPGLGRVFNYSAINHLGVSVSSSLIGISPLFSVIVAILFLKEPFSWAIVGGVALIIFGIYILNKTRTHKKFDKKYLLLPLAAALFYGLSSPLNKLGLSHINNPILGATITSTMSLFIVLIYLGGSRALHRLKVTRHAAIFYIFSGLATVVAFMFNFNALRLGDVSIVAPLGNTFPLFAVFLSYLFHKNTEKITWHIWLGALIIVAGAAVISFV